jgi:polyisoprenoid-binding protein YceI
MTTAQETKTSIPTGEWKSEPVHSHAGFTVKHTAATFRGEFKDFDASLAEVDGEPKLSGSLRVDSVSVDSDDLAAHLAAPEFFDAQRYPEIGFESTAIKADGEKLIVEGELSVKGVTKKVAAQGEISGPVAGPDGKDRLGLDLETKVNRYDYGLDWQAELPDGGKVLGDEVTISAQLELVQES